MASKYKTFRVDDDSMDDGDAYALCEGDIVLARKIDPKYWPMLRVGRRSIVLVFENDDYTMRRIISFDAEKMTVLCHPLNPMYEDVTFNLNDLLELYNVIKIVDKNTGI
jgi:SOS-response transcriptional repressor LexA